MSGPPSKPPGRPPRRPGQRPPGARSPQELLAQRTRRRLTPEEKAKAAVFSGKDAWGYRFAQPIWRLELGLGETMKRAPEDKERERLLAVLGRELELTPARIEHGLTGEELPWGLLREDKKTRRRRFAEAVREASKKTAGGRLGIQQAHYLAHQEGLMRTFRARADRAAFPLELSIEEVVLKSTWSAGYVLHLDRVFYPVHKLPQVDRFAQPLIVADGYRLLDGRGESVVRTHDRKLKASIEASSISSPAAAFDWRITLGERCFTLREPRTIRSPAFRLEDAMGAEVGGCDSALDPASTKLDVTFRFDVSDDGAPWLALAIIYLDAFTQRARGVLGRAEAAAIERAEAEAAEAAALLEKEKL